MRRCRKAAYVLTLLSLNTSAYAGAFQLWEQDGASVGNYHAGRVAVAEDASTAFYNPAGMIRIPNQEIVMGLVPVLTSLKYTGTVTVLNAATDPPGTIIPPTDVVAQGGTFNVLPDLHYVTPLADNLMFGLSVVAPFGAETNYGSDTVLRYASTLNSLKVVDVAPSLGFAMNSHLSLGAGLDAEYASGQFELYGAGSGPDQDTLSNNQGSSKAIGFHLGALYQFNPDARIGLTYQSQVTHRLHGQSTFTGFLANDGDGGTQESGDFSVSIPLPATTTLSGFYTINPVWDVMATVIYTQWDVFKNTIFNNVSGINEGVATNTLTVVVPQNYHNSWNYSLGANYHMNDQWFIRTGVGYDQTPSNDTDRNVQIPDQTRIALACGAHYQLSKTLGIDAGWTHFFMINSSDINNNINNLAQVGDQIVITNGNVNGNADVYSLQLKWDIA